MRKLKAGAMLALLAALFLAAGGAVAQDLLPRPSEQEVIDVPNDDGSKLGVLFKLDGSAPPSTSISIQVLGAEDLLKPFAVTEAQRNTLNNALADLEAAVSPVLQARDDLRVTLSQIDADLTLLVNNNDPGAKDKRREKWRVANELAAKQKVIEKAHNAFLAKAGPIKEKADIYDALQAASAQSQYLPTDAGGDPAGFPTKGNFPEIFGQDPPDADKFYLEIASILVANPLAEPQNMIGDSGHDKYGFEPAPQLQIPLSKGGKYVLQMLVSAPPPVPEAAAAEAEAAEAAAAETIETPETAEATEEAPVEGEAEGETEAPVIAAAEPPAPLERTYDLGMGQPRAAFFKTTYINNLIFSVVFAVIILVAITRARRNPNMFIRRISGLEAVDEAIGRATEMGKPVLYLNGMNDLSDLSTLAAINILGRVARRIADYDSSLIVPTRDPVVMTVAQEVVREGYIDVGRPDAFRQDNIFFVTDDQFAFTAATCGIMMRDKPAANFFMGYYYAESLLLTETGASVGAIQIAGTDSQSQLPFFITTCDYTLIGEELYAASAYLSREPMLLGSLKGQDVGKAVLMIVIIVQTLLFLIMALTGAQDLDFIKNLVKPL